MTFLKKVSGYLTVLSVLVLQQAVGQTNTPTADTKVAATGIVGYKPAAYSAGAVVNYVRTWEPRQPYSVQDSVISSYRLVSEVARATQYVDGLGRPVQTVNWQSSPVKKDLVAPAVYDSLGREMYKFLPP